MASGLLRSASMSTPSLRPSSPFRKRVTSPFRRANTMPADAKEPDKADASGGGCKEQEAQQEESGNGTEDTAPPPPAAPTSPAEPPAAPSIPVSDVAVDRSDTADNANDVEVSNHSKNNDGSASAVVHCDASEITSPVKNDGTTAPNGGIGERPWDNYVEGKHLAAVSEITTIVTTEAEDCDETETVIETIADGTDFKSGNDDHTFSTMYDAEGNTMYDTATYMKSAATIGENMSDVASQAPSEAPSESSIKVLWRYMGMGDKKYMDPSLKRSSKNCDVQVKFIHDLQEGDHVIRWKMLGYCYPIQVHGIVFSVGPDFVTIVDCGVETYSNLDKVGNFDEDQKKKKRERKRLNIVTLVDEKEIKKWTKIRYGEEVELKVHSSNEEMQQEVNEKDVLKDCAKKDKIAADAEEEASPTAGLEMEEVEKCVQAKVKPTPASPRRLKKASSSSSWLWGDWHSCNDSTTAEDADSKPVAKETPKQNNNTEKLRLPKADPPSLVLARLRFLLEYGEEPWPPMPSGSESHSKKTKPKPNLLPPNHLLYANSECIAVFCKIGQWSTLQASIFLHSSTVGNVKQTATLAMFLSAQTVTVPASGIWGFFGGTTTIGLFTAQPWLVPALVGGGFVYVGLPTLMLWKAKGRWGETEKKLNHAFWSMHESDDTLVMIQTQSLEGRD